MSEIERNKIDAYLMYGKSVPEITKLLKILVGVLFNYSWDHEIYNKNCNKKSNHAYLQGIICGLAYSNNLNETLLAKTGFTII